MNRLEGKVALVSGAAGGIGGAVARRFAAEGAKVWLNDLDQSGLAELTDELTAAGATAHAAAGDGTDRAFVDGWIAGVIAAEGRIDVLYNGLGMSRAALVADISDEDWRFVQRVTLDSVFLATRAVLPHMVRQGGGSIVTMSSGAGVGGQYALGSYGAAKAGVINLMETVALEYGPQGIRANAVTPGPTATPPLLRYLGTQPGGVAEHVGGLDLQRLSQPDEVANTVMWLASDESSNITGICLRSNIRSASSRPF
jgi:NAD(P)-dependent dehydrogenase (short-subunit alcohol dehydrogenase family)